MGRSAAGLSGSTSFFDRWSSTYDQTGLQALAYRPIHDAVLGRLDTADPDTAGPDTVVDLGCGTGQLTQRLIGRFPRAAVIGIDFSPGMLAAASTRLDPASGGLIRADAQSLPLRPGSVDVVVCTESFHWYRDQIGALRGLAAAIRPGGRLLIASIAMTTGIGDDAVRRVSSARGRPIRALPPQRIRSIVVGAGFEVIHQRRIPRLGLIPWPVLTDCVRR
jgi:ubiquinone/menaquinone biosynthesis C-methylase UbiE